MAGSPAQDLCDEAICSICLEYFQDPVIIPECGHNFCRSCLSQWWEKSEAEASCPQCREQIKQRNLIPNQPLATVLETLRAKELSLQGWETVAGKEGRCETHQEPLKLFCKDHKRPICLVCDRSKEHENHKVIPLEEASQEYKDQISSCLDNLRKKKEKTLAFKADVEKESQDLLKQIEAEKGKMVAEFRRLRQFLEEQEKALLAQMAEVEKEIAKKREEQRARLSGELSSLESLIREMEEKRWQPANEQLQDIGSFLQRSQAKEKLENLPVPFPSALKWKVWDFCDINPFLEGVMKQFRDSLGSGLQLRKENVTLDPDTANPWLLLSEDRKSVRRGGERQVLPDRPERFNNYYYVLGREGFTAGRHFWEVTVGRDEGWAVGVAKSSVQRKQVITAGPEEGVWDLGKWGGAYRAACLGSRTVLPLSCEPRRIRVALNCEGRRMAFYDADRAARLCTFSAASFSGETLQPLFSVFSKGHLNLAA
ncbi:E3 ubiquitin-protein ligase TRIM7-like isoform X1 [Podarcis raffonei]|uniref:E3 ubiquitin-protein ligase TRIM7-like isoform X1 n=1 Tax=Podarcis raffonei TaxID=65483 RepID=UPI0023298705|nr:E3 ubiquitin-protein ligase TRIM7-like isoform X1 [Podarcis raffonei]